MDPASLIRDGSALVRLWREKERQWNEKLLSPIGVLWMAEEDDSFERASLPPLKEAGIPYEELPAEELKSGGRRLILNVSAGGFMNRTAVICWHGLLAKRWWSILWTEGGSYRQIAVTPPATEEASGKAWISPTDRS